MGLAEIEWAERTTQTVTISRRSRRIGMNLIQIASIQRSLLAADTFDPHAQAINSFAGGDEQQVAIFPAKADVRGPGFRDGNVRNLFSGRIENGDAVSGDIDVSFIVDGHAVLARLAKKRFVFERTVAFDVVTERALGSYVSHVQGLSVWSADDAIRLLQIINHARQLFLVR